jgi:hypothetical protein
MTIELVHARRHFVLTKILTSGQNAMKTVMKSDTIKALTTHYIDGAYIESHGRQVMDIIKPTNGQVIGRVMLGDEEDTRRSIAAAKRALASFGRTSKEGRTLALLAPVT